MTDYVWYPVSGNGQSPSTAYTWDNATANWNTGSWIVGDALIFGNPSIVPGDVPGSGVGTSGGPGQDSVGLIAGEINTAAYGFYEAFVANPAHGDPYFSSNDYKVDLLINSGTVELNSLLLAGFNTFADTGIAEFPTVDVEGATLKLDGSIIDTFSAVFPSFGTETASGGGTIDLGSSATVDVAGSVQADIVMQFAGASLLTLGAVSSTDTAAFNGTIAGFGTGDTIDLTALSFSTGNTVSFDGTTDLLAINSGTTTLATLQLSGTYTASDFHLIDDGNGNTAIVTCFAAGTRIRTMYGEVAVEALRVGERVAVARGGAEAPVVWIGRRRIDCRRHPHPELVWPVRITAGAFGEGAPRRDLYLSPDHAVFVDDVLIPVKYLIDGNAIAQVKQDDVVYYHVELPRHDVLLAEGLTVESYLDTGDRFAFDNGGGVVEAYPDFATRAWEAIGCARLVVTGAKLEAVKARVRSVCLDIAA